MKKFFSYFFGIIFVTCSIAGGIGYYYRSELFHTAPVHSPIPEFLMLAHNNQVTLLDFWSPVIQKIQGSTGDLPDLSAQSVLMYDLTANKIIYEKSPNS